MKCFIQIFEQFRWAEAMMMDIIRLGLTPVLVDNDSQHEETQDWLGAMVDDGHEVRYVGHNSGNHGFWGLPNPELTGEEPYCFTDPDLDLSGVPDDAVQVLLAALEANEDVAKVGLSLSIDNIREDIKDAVLSFENRYWETKRESGVWFAQVDTTFALYDPKRSALLKRNFYQSVRLDKPYTARHIPWDYDYSKATPDVMAYLKAATAVAHWTTVQKRLMGMLPAPVVEEKTVPEPVTELSEVVSEPEPVVETIKTKKRKNK